MFLSMELTYDSFDLRIQLMDYDLVMVKYFFPAKIQTNKSMKEIVWKVNLDFQCISDDFMKL